ncbi:MAG: MoaD/ThiS family protein [Candidatus Hadarchaeota archaeon]
MKVKVELMPGLRQQRKEKIELELPEGTTVRAMLLKLDFRESEIEPLRVFVNGELAGLNKALKDGDDIWVGMVIGGG